MESLGRTTSQFLLEHGEAKVVLMAIPLDFFHQYPPFISLQLIYSPQSLGDGYSVEAISAHNYSYARMR
jgi:hypothetical protein